MPNLVKNFAGYFKITAIFTIMMAAVWYFWAINPALQFINSVVDKQHDISLWFLPLENGHNSFKEKKGVFDYLPNFKNPCWLEKATHQLRCFPFVYELGVAKCGTSALYKHLIKHPDIVPARRKELFFWHTVYGRKGFRSYLDELAGATAIINKSVDAKGFHGKITIDATPRYFTSFGNISSVPGNMKDGEPLYTTPHRLYTVNRDSKFIVIMKNPVDRLYSHYYHFHYKTASAEEFHKLVVNARRMMSDCLALRTLRSCACDTLLNERINQKKHITLHFSMYYPYAKEWLSVFPRNQFRFIKGEEFYADPVPILKEIFQFLELDDLDEATYKEIHATVTGNYTHRKKEAMLPQTRRILEDFLRPYNTMLAKLLHDRKFEFF